MAKLYPEAFVVFSCFLDSERERETRGREKETEGGRRDCAFSLFTK